MGEIKSYSAFLVFLLSATLCALEPTADPEENEVLTVAKDAGSRRDVRSMITEEVIQEVFKEGEATLEERKDLLRKLVKRGRVIKTSERKTDPSLIRMRNFDPIVHSREMEQLPFDEASNNLYHRFDLTRNEISQTLPTLPLRDTMSRSYRDNCTQTVAPEQCDVDARFRTANGQCNNLQNPTWGSALSCQRRLLPANYDGNSGFRQSVAGGPLPAPRTLSLNLHNHLNRPTNYVTHMYMFFGQLLDHDIALTPVSTTEDNEAIECCPPTEETHPQCRPILIDNNDPFYSQFGVTCLNFVRSAICSTCILGDRQQMDQVTAFIDASFVYGNSDNETASLRSNDGTGRLRIQRSNYGDLLPRSRDPNNDQCSFPETDDICFEAGDPRVNQHTVLTSLQTIFVREHNRIVGGLRQVNPNWGEERLFQEARRIVGAEMQVITYKEYLPITLGKDRMNYFKLWTGSTTSYNPETNPTMILEFSTTAFRFGHSLINSVVANNPLNSTNGRRLLRDEFFQPFDLYRGLAGPLVKGASDSPAQWFDRHLVQDVTNFLYRIRGDRTGLDLAATNINRGRDHGMPTYVEMVRYCSEGEIVIRSFNDLVNRDLMEYEQAEALRRNYRNVNDIDLWTAILMEIPNENAVVGPTGACIIGMQFHNLKFGDRFYFEHRNVARRFTSNQMEELSKVSLSRIICLNTDVSQMSVNAMIFNSRNNPRINCRYVRGVDLQYWAE